MMLTIGKIEKRMKEIETVVRDLDRAVEFYAKFYFMPYSHENTMIAGKPAAICRLVNKDGEIIIVDATETLKQAGRERYKRYVQSGYTGVRQEDRSRRGYLPAVAQAR